MEERVYFHLLISYSVFKLYIAASKSYRLVWGSKFNFDNLILFLIISYKKVCFADQDFCTFF